MEVLCLKVAFALCKFSKLVDKGTAFIALGSWTSACFRAHHKTCYPLVQEPVVSASQPANPPVESRLSSSPLVGDKLVADKQTSMLVRTTSSHKEVHPSASSRPA